MNERVIITGHSGGLGAALSRAWLECEAKVLGIARRSNPSLKNDFPDDFYEVSLDLSNIEQLREWLETPQYDEFFQEGTRIWLFNNAATIGDSKNIGMQTPDAINHAIALNVTAPFILSEVFAAWAERKKIPLNIVHISSGAGRKSYPGWSCYGATKAALDMHARVALSENNPLITVVSIAPGVVDTPMQKAIRNNLYFPARERFVALHENHKLQNVDDTAMQILSYCLSGLFGTNPVVDVRQLPA